jgi:5-formyltetrahydrofolate cyclo-ligase
MPPDERIRADQKITECVISRTEWKKAETVCLYMSLPDEVDTKSLVAAALNGQKTVVFPRVENGRLILHRITSVTDFTLGAYHILEPKKSMPLVDPTSVDLFIVPGIVFDWDGYRLGHGKGYYDRLLAGIDAPKIGLAYAVQMIAKVPHTSYDVPMTVVVTEEGTYALASAP